MKTAQEAAQELLDDTGQYSDLSDYISGSEIAYITSYFSDFEKAIRKDQDKITRKACAKNAHDVEYICETPNGNDAYLMDDIQEAILNTKAI